MKLHRILMLMSLFFLISCQEGQVSIEDKERFELSIIQGNLIVDAVFRYMSENDHYPDSLQMLIPNYLEIIPKTNTRKDFIYIRLANINGYDGLPGFSLVFTLNSGFFFGNSNTYFLFSSDKNYENTTKQKTHFVVNNWAYVTSYRHEIGKAGRIE